MRPVVRELARVTPIPLAPGVSGAELLGDEHGCRGLHQRRLRFASGATLGGSAAGRGEAWYVISGSGTLDAGGSEAVVLRPGTAVWMRPPVRYRCRARAGPELEVVVAIVRAGSAGDDDAGPAVCVATLADCEPERTGDREFRVLLSAGLTITQFAGLIPPGRAPAHQHSYDEVVHVLSGRGIVHLDGSTAAIGAGTSIYLPPYQAHCLENTGPEPLEVLGVFHPARSPAAKRAC